MIKIENPADCSGCTACQAICPHDCISMQPDALGFLYPKVNLETCTNCHLCEKVCPFHKDYDKSENLTKPETYAARHKDMHEVETSQSGAAFIALSDYILSLGGVIYGVGFVDKFRAAYKRAETKQERDEFKGSKYVQAYLGDILKKVKEDLKNGKTVLFSGTPCYTAGVHAFINKNLRKNLYLVDIICHGVPSPYIWRDYLEFIEKQENAKITKANFRDKKHGWSSHKETFNFVKNGIEENKTFTHYSFTFYKHIMLRHSCANCQFCNLQRPSDITIGDFWGWNKVAPQLEAGDNKGYSLILINTEKGQNLLEHSKKDFKLTPVDIQNALQPNLQHPSKPHKNRQKFEDDYKNQGFNYIFKKYSQPTFREILWRKLYIPRQIAKKILVFLKLRKA